MDGWMDDKWDVGVGGGVSERESVNGQQEG